MIKVNDKDVEYSDGISVSDLIRKCGFQYPLLIVKIDNVYVPRDKYNATKVPDSSDVQITNLVSGG
ncbi:MAG: sulfur carrier protein ThiS [Candidatus Riflebacteria bacterium]|nr:sulfur carrier protein ThiS [Candidatus Riflebacteria bacterium]